ncbi:hypothetical protein [Nocardioides sp. zg-1228]|uniref:hypothetical protein n=1 Tax=Nocardioides sp. zg-1228 TaxID=2763008 RepID=UPI0016430C49|nr:hypothetical protein [Nocardioides sp. zg-1228]MBC2934222.1 hypothetical protein [Nocardioides sp. zg-1228]QSF58966.1 hypothetical protein JX575_07265 [Nocardioides sp. zg-1228]
MTRTTARTPARPTPPTSATRDLAGFLAGLLAAAVALAALLLGSLTTVAADAADAVDPASAEHPTSWRGGGDDHDHDDDHDDDHGSHGGGTDDGPGDDNGGSGDSGGRDDDRVIRTGACGAGADWKLKVKTDDGRLEVEGEIDSFVAGQQWRWTLRHNGSVSDRGVGTTTARSGSFEVERKVVDLRGTDTLAFRAVRAGQTCAGVVNY